MIFGYMKKSEDYFIDFVYDKTGGEAAWTMPVIFTAYKINGEMVNVR